MTTYHADTCPVCLYRIKTRAEDGTMMKHNYKNQKANGTCAGSYRVPLHRKPRKTQTPSWSAEGTIPEPVEITIGSLGTFYNKPSILERIKRIWRK